MLRTRPSEGKQKPQCQGRQTAKENKSLNAKDAENAKENKSLNAKDAKEMKCSQCQGR